MDELASGLDVAAAIRAKEVSPLEVLDECLARVDVCNTELNAVIWRNDEEARAEARALGERIAGEVADLPPFAGVPLPIKDLLPVEGQPVTYGSRGAPEGPSATSGPIADAFVRAGFILTGRTNTPEFGSITVTENERFGVTRNPWNTGHTSGGSSGGAGSAVAAGMFPVAHASDGGGSIRIPASCCGLVGLKPSRGRVAATFPRLGLRPTSPQHDAGIRIEPPPSLAWATGNMPAATAEPAPPLDPPEVWPVFQGLRVTPNRSFSVTVIDPNSGVLVRPVRMKPARTNASAIGPLVSLGPSGAPRDP